MGAGTIILSIVTGLLILIQIIIFIYTIPAHLHNYSTLSITNTKSLRIGIVGAGIAGLNTALTLVDSNLFSPENIYIYEAYENVGGRIHSKIWLPDNLTSEWCGEFLDSNNYVMFNLTNRFNISLLDTIEETRKKYHSTLYFLKRFYNQTQAWIDYQSIANIIKEQLVSIGQINYNQSNSYGRYFDKLSLYDWIEKYVPNGHRSELGQYIDSAYLQEYGLDTQQQSSLMFLFLISPFSQPKDGPLSIYGLSDQRYRMIGGNGQLPNGIGQYLTDHGVNIRVDHNLTKISRLKNRKYQLTFSNNRTYIYDHVILTLPVSTLRYVDYSEAGFDLLKIRVIQELRYGTNTKMDLKFTKRFWHDLSADGSIYTDLPFLNSWDESVGQPGETGLLTLFTGGSDGTSFTPRTAFDTIFSSSKDLSSPSIYIDRFLGELDQIWPNSSKYYAGECSISAPWYSKYFLGSYPAYIPGQYATIHGYESVRQGNIHFAGDYASMNFFGLQEGAASEGARAANEIINDYI